MKRYLLCFLLGLLFLSGCGTPMPADSCAASEPPEITAPSAALDYGQTSEYANPSSEVYPEPGQMSCAIANASAPEETVSSVETFTVVVENQCDDPIHGIGFEYTLNDTVTDSVLCTVQDGGWVSSGEPIAQVFDAELLGTTSITQFTAKVFVVSAGSAQFCLSDPIDIVPEDSGIYTWALTGNEQEGYWIE